MLCNRSQGYLWAAAGRAGQPEVVSIAVKPDPAVIAHLGSIGVTECAFGLPDKGEEEVKAYLGRLRAKLDA